VEGATDDSAGEHLSQGEQPMDRHFLEFWGNYLTNAAKGQKQLEDMAEWMGQGLRGFEYLTTLFRKSYGLDELEVDSPEYLKTWKKAEQDFRIAFKDYLSFFGVVPSEEHLALVKQYEELKETAAAQEETIKHLRLLLSQKMVDQGEASGSRLALKCLGFQN
jgi:hypothetical protein